MNYADRDAGGLNTGRCRYGEVIFTGSFSQLALPTSIHQLTGDNRCQNPDGPLNRKSSTLLGDADDFLDSQEMKNVY